MATHEMYFADEKSRKQYMVKKVISSILLYAFITFFALIILLPFYYMVVTSLVSQSAYDQAKLTGSLILFPSSDQFSFSNYQSIFADTYVNELGKVSSRTSFTTFFVNTLIVAIISTTVTTVTSVLSAFAFARLEFKGKNALFFLILATMMIPGEMMILTNYQTTMQLDWGNSFAGLTLVHGVSVFYIFYLRQTFQQIPNELYLAAKVDGYSDFQYLLKVMAPIGSPTIMTIVILSLMGSWNAYVWPSLIAMGKWNFGKNVLGIDWDIRLVANGLMSIFNGEFQSQDAVKIAGSMVVTAPLFVFFLCFRKYIMKGVSRSGIKG